MSSLVTSIYCFIEVKSVHFNFSKQVYLFKFILVTPGIFNHSLVSETSHPHCKSQLGEPDLVLNHHIQDHLQHHSEQETSLRQE